MDTCETYPRACGHTSNPESSLALTSRHHHHPQLAHLHAMTGVLCKFLCPDTSSDSSSCVLSPQLSIARQHGDPRKPTGKELRDAKLAESLLPADAGPNKRPPGMMRGLSLGSLPTAAVQGKSFPTMKIVWLFCTTILSPVLGLPVVPCDHAALAKTITGFCTSPNGRCCTAVANAVVRGSNPPCLCNVLQEDIIHKSGMTAEEIIHMYYSCGGTAAVTRLEKVCREIGVPGGDKKYSYNGTHG